MLSRLGRWYDEHRVAGDLALTGLLLVVVLPTDLAAPGDVAAGLAFSLALLSVVPLRRRAPVSVFAVVCGLCLAQLAVLDRMVAGDVVALIALYTVVADVPSTRLGALATVCMVVGALLSAARWDTAEVDASLLGIAATLVGAVLLAATLGAWRRSRRAELAALLERSDLLARERDQQAAVGAAVERARIARELHDIVAHSLSVIIVQADGAAAGAEQRPAAAAAALRTISDTGREALGQMRRLLGVLRAEGDDRAELTPQPGVSQLETLVAQVARAGLPARLAVQGSPRPLDGPADLALYRVAQEALTNVVRHAGAVTRVEVVLRYRDDAVELLVSDDGAGRNGAGDGGADGQGHGLVGMRERVGLQDGTLVAGPGPEVGFAVRAVIPTARVTAPA